MSGTLPTTKKLLVPFNPLKPDSITRDFLMPSVDGNEAVLRRIGSGRVSKYGLLVYTGVAVSVDDILAKLAASGGDVTNSEPTLHLLTQYLNQLHEFKIGNVLMVQCDPLAAGGFRLQKFADTPSGANKLLAPHS
jgi:hypothetical protein